MLINAADLAFKGFKTLFNQGWERTPTFSGKIAMTVRSGTREENYGWFGQFPELREWVSGERMVRQLEAFKCAIVNKKFEATIGVKRDDFDDDRYGLYGVAFQRMGETAKRHPGIAAGHRPRHRLRAPGRGCIPPRPGRHRAGGRVDHRPRRPRQRHLGPRRLDRQGAGAPGRAGVPLPQPGHRPRQGRHRAAHQGRGPGA